MDSDFYEHQTTCFIQSYDSIVNVAKAGIAPGLWHHERNCITLTTI